MQTGYGINRHPRPQMKPQQLSVHEPRSVVRHSLQMADRVSSSWNFSEFEQGYRSYAPPPCNYQAGPLPRQPHSYVVNLEYPMAGEHPSDYLLDEVSFSSMPIQGQNRQLSNQHFRMAHVQVKSAEAQLHQHKQLVQPVQHTGAIPASQWPLPSSSLHLSFGDVPAPATIPLPATGGSKFPNHKSRRSNPPMPLLPLPEQRIPISRSSIQDPLEGSNKVTIKNDRSAQKTGTSHRPKYLQVVLFPDRFLSGSIQQLYKWNGVKHKIPPIYETAGIVSQTPIAGPHRTERRFSLSNLPQWHLNPYGPRSKELHCVYFVTAKSAFDLPHGATLRVVGRFLADTGLFQCLKVRKSELYDIAWLTSCVKKARPPTKSENEVDVDAACNDMDIQI